MEKLALALITASRKLRPYFYAHTKVVLTNYPLRQVLQKPDASEHLHKWAVELWQFEVDYKPREAKKGQAVADFIADFSYKATADEMAWEHQEQPEGAGKLTLGNEGQSEDQLAVYVDDSSNKNGLGAGIVLVSLKGHRVHSALKFDFKASNNEAKYEALIAGLQLALEMKARCLSVYNDSQLVVNQIGGEYQAKNDKILQYLVFTHDLIAKFQKVSFRQILRGETPMLTR